jgi:hypothetical protein
MSKCRTFLFILAVLVCDIFGAKVEARVKLSPAELASLSGGISPFSASDCVAGVGGCPGGMLINGNGDNSNPQSTTCDGQDMGRVCANCSSAANQACSGTYSTWNPFHNNCVGTPKSCTGTSGWCVNGQCDNSAGAPNSPPSCGSHTTCHN